MSFSKFAAISVLVLFAVTGVSAAFAQTITVGGKNFTEQRLIAEMTRQLLQARGLAARTKVGLSSTGIRREQEAGLVDVYWEYTGTSLLTFNKVGEKLGPAEAYARVAELDAGIGLIWLAPSKVNNTYALAMRRAEAEAKGIKSISDLAARSRRGESFRFGFNTEFYVRPDGLLPLQRAYQFEFGPKDLVRMDTGAVYDFVRDGTASEVGLVFSTDGRIVAYDLTVLYDDLGFFPAYLLTPVVRKSILDEHPDLEAHLNGLSAKLDNSVMANLNAEIDVLKSPVEAVAATYLRASGLL